jgi:hypothetical protein
LVTITRDDNRVMINTDMIHGRGEAFACSSIGNCSHMDIKLSIPCDLSSFHCRTFKLSDERAWRGACCSEHDP